MEKAVSLGGAIRFLYRKISDAAKPRRRRQLSLSVRSQPGAAPTVYFLTPDYVTPSGGIRVIYRHVDILNTHGVNAYVLHQQPGFRCTWFDHQTRVTDVASAQLRQGDFLVMAEVDAYLLPRMPAGLNYAIFNQNSHLTWQNVTGRALRKSIADINVAGIVTVSEHNQQMLAHAFPGEPVHRIHLAIDPALFHNQAGPRPRRITYMPRPRGDNATQVIEMLRGRGTLDGWDIVPLKGLSHAQVAEEFRRSRIFLAFTHQEGFGLPAAEAMACGNYVIGSHGGGGKEFFLPRFSRVVEGADTFGFVRAVEDVLRNDRAENWWCGKRGALASEFILREYSMGRERGDVIELYSAFLGKARQETRVVA
jgi:hypothetical protein